ncbi:PAP2 superfamily protein [Pseudoduganella lurida]|uniref:PAP2 superfamily protein n=2 Tax=Pseudoduganella lurida TaxID=1036180 RepID=A0A562RF43_9BURK|nr:PAP2 superfamily protein [Pseudoduganella lurida]
MLLWKALTALGGVTVTGPLGVAVAVWLLAGRSWRLSLNWMLLFCGGMALVVITKLLWYGWGIGIQAWHFSGLSGHAMRATAVYPVVFFLAFRNARPGYRTLGLAAGVLLAFLISYSRLPVRAHSVSEVVLGGAVGYAVAAAFILGVRGERPAIVTDLLLALCIPLVIIMPLTKPAPAERWIKQIAMYLTGKDPIERAWKQRPDGEPASQADVEPDQQPDAQPEVRQAPVQVRGPI